MCPSSSKRPCRTKMRLATASSFLARCDAVMILAGRNVAPQRDGLFRLDVGGADHLAPFLGFSGDERAELGGGHRHRAPAEIGEPRLQPGIREAGIDFPVEPLDDLGWGALGRPDAIPLARLVARPGTRP